MKNKKVIIFWNERLHEQRGGIHRVILLLLQHLPQRGFDVQYLYTLDNYKTFNIYSPNLSKEHSFGVECLRSYLVDNKCDIVVGQDAALSSKLTEIIRSFNLINIKLINEYHSSFLLIPAKLTRDYLKFEFEQNHSLKSRISVAVKYLLYPLWKKKVWKNISDSFRYNLVNSDISLLLTEREIPIAQTILGNKKETKLVAINNPLSWDEIASPSILDRKKKEVLVVARLYNPEKRIDLVLKIWNLLLERGIAGDWTLRICGDGLHKDYLMQLAEKLYLRNVIWEGWCDPKPFYETSSIFMMTSACEGWGLTLTESMQSGTVPLAFSTYPAVYDIINDGYDGFIVNPNDINVYADRMEKLMADSEYRHKIALNALDSCKRFSTKKIMDKWAEMLHSV